MDDYQKQIEQLARRIRSLETDWLPSGMSSALGPMIEELDLVPVSGKESPYYPQRLTQESVPAILEDLGYTCREGADYVQVETDEGRIQINLDNLPMVSVTSGFLVNESEEGMKSLRKAVLDINDSWGMVKATVGREEDHVLIYIHARHPDVVSFRENIRYYIETVGAATAELRENYNGYERERLMDSFKQKHGKNFLS